MNWSARMLRFCGISHSSTTSKAAFSFRRVTKKTPAMLRSEEHTSEFQSPCNLVCRLLLEKKKWYLAEVIRIAMADGPLPEGGRHAPLAVGIDLGVTQAQFGGVVVFFFFNDTATTEIYTLSLHDAIPIWERAPVVKRRCDSGRIRDVAS